MLLTGDYPFDPQGFPDKAPNTVCLAERETWNQFEAMGVLHKEWVRSWSLKTFCCKRIQVEMM